MTTARRAGTALTALLLMAGAAGCDSTSAASPVTTPSSVVPTLPPSMTSTPVASGSSTASALTSSTQLAQAEDVYREVISEQMQLYKAGGIAKGKPAPTSLSQLATGDALSWIMDELNQANALKLHNWKGETRTLKIKEGPVVEQHSGSSITLYSCEDGRAVLNTGGDGKTTTGSLSVIVSSYKVVNDKLVMVYYNDDKSVTKCPL